MKRTLLTVIAILASIAFIMSAQLYKNYSPGLSNGKTVAETPVQTEAVVMPTQMPVLWQRPAPSPLSEPSPSPTPLATPEPGDSEGDQATSSPEQGFEITERHSGGVIGRQEFIENFNRKSKDAGFTLSTDEKGPEYSLPGNITLTFDDGSIVLTVKPESDFRYAMADIGLMMYAVDPGGDASVRKDMLDRMNIIASYDAGKPFSCVDLLDDYSYTAAMDEDKVFTFTIAALVNQE